MVPVLPPSAPFDADQRAWLNGFLAGVFGMDNGAPRASASPSFPSAGAVAAVVDEAPADESTPWHDPNLELDERMALADGRPRPMQLMAAMAQLDCGQCGYLCQSYAAAIADGSEKSLKKCIPGAKPTALKLKELMAS